MLTSTAIWTCVALYLAFLLGVASYVRIRGKRQGEEKMLTAKVNSLTLIMTYVASLMSVWIFFSGPGAYYRGGIGYWLSEMSYIAVFPVVAHFTMNQIWRINKLHGDRLITPADFFDLRFRSKALRAILGIIFLTTSFPYISSVLVAIGQAAQYATNQAVAYEQAVLIIGLGMTLFVAIGGTKSTAMADTVQGIVFILLLWIIVVMILNCGFGGDAAEPIRQIWTTTPEFFSYPGPEGWMGYANRLGYPLSCAIGWTVMLPHVFVRAGYYGNTVEDQRRLCYAAPILQAVVWTGTMCLGLLALAFSPGLKAGETELLIPYMIETVLQYKNMAVAQFLMFSFFLGTCAVGLSTANAFLSVSTAILSHDFLEEVFGIQFRGKRELWSQRMIIGIVGGVSTLLALDPPQLIYTLVMFAIALVMPLFPILLCTIYWKRATKQAAIASSVVGTVLVLCTYFIWHVGDTWYGTFGLLGSTVTMILISFLTKPAPEDSTYFFSLVQRCSKPTAATGDGSAVSVK